MTGSSRFKKSWTSAEIAFIIGYADYCIHHGKEYMATVASELQKRSSREVSASTIRGKIDKTFAHVSEVSAKELISQGTACLDAVMIPPDVLPQLNELRHSWHLPSLQANRPQDYVSITDHQSTPSVENPVVMQAGMDNRSETLQVEEIPEADNGTIPAVDGAVDRPQMSPISTHTSSPVSHTKSTSVKRKARVMDTSESDYEDSTDPDYEVSSKKIKPSVIDLRCNAPKGPRGIAVVKKTSGIAMKARNSSKVQRPHDITDDDQESEKSPSAGPSRQVPESGAEASSGDKRKRQATPTAEVGDVTSETLSKRQKTGDLTIESLNEKVDILMSTMSILINNQQGLSEDTLDHLEQNLRIAKDSKGSKIENLIDDLTSQRLQKVKYRAMVRKLIDFVDSNTGLVFPKEPYHREVNRSWAEFYDHILFTVGVNNTRPRISLASAGYLAGATENIAYGRIASDQLKTYIESLQGPIKSPHAQQALLSALFCRWVFSTPEAMLDHMHSDGMMHLYKGMLNSAESNAAGLDRVQQYDKAAAKSLFEDPIFKEVEVAHRITKLESRLQAVKEKICKESDIPCRKSPTQFVEEVVEFKKQLLLSPKNYRIHYVRPGTPFDPQWMQAYNFENDTVSEEKAAGKQIVLCIFPALTCEEAEATNEDTKIEEMLVKNKRFLPTIQESIAFDPKMQLSKAVVLVKE